MTHDIGRNTQVADGAAHDTSGWWRQVTKLPKPIQQYPPLTLRYGLFVVHPAVTAVPAPVAFQFSLVLISGLGG